MSPDSFIGSIGTFAGTFAPDGWADCNGQVLQVNQYQALYSLIGSTYGGDSKCTNFHVPDLRPEVNGVKVDWSQVKQPRQCIALLGLYPTRP
jgi:microcystin-dependent protein